MEQNLQIKPSILLVGIILLGSSVMVNSNNHDLSNDIINEGFPPISYEGHSPLTIQEIIDQINETLVQKYLEELVAFGPRMTGTSSCGQAAAYLFDQFSHMSLDTIYHNWSLWDPGLSPKVFTGSNIVATLPGHNSSSDKIVIFNAHYDTVKISIGADDDASGVASVLSAAHVLSRYQFGHTLRFIAFSGEEEGLLGSMAYARRAYENRDNIYVALNADMIGHTETPQGGNTFRMYGTEDVSWVLDTVEDINRDHGFNYDFTRRTISGGGGGGSDYYSFLQYGFEAIAFFEGEWNPHMHTRQDTLDNVNVSYLTQNTRLITGILATLANEPLTHPQAKIVSPQRGRLYLNGKIVNTLPTEQTIVLDEILIQVEKSSGDHPITKVEFYYDDTLKSTDEVPPFQWNMNLLSLGSHAIKVIIYDESGEISQDLISLFYINLPHIP